METTADPSDVGRCVSCGFLSREDEQTIYREVTPEIRSQTVELAGSLRGSRGPFRPACYRHAAQLLDEALSVELGQPHVVRPARYADAPSEAIATIIQRDRRCPKWMAYEPGESPKEHLTRFKEGQLETLRAESIKALTDIQRATSSDIETSMQLQKEIRDLEMRQDDFSKWALRIAIAAIIIAAVGVAFTVMGYIRSSTGSSEQYYATPAPSPTASTH